MKTAVARLLAGVAVLAAVGVGVALASTLTRDSETAVDALLASRVSPDDAQRDALALEPSYRSSEAFYRTRVDEAAAALDIAAPSLDDLRAVNAFEHTIPTRPRELAIGEDFTAGGLKVAIELRALTVMQRGVQRDSEHTLAVVRNIGARPLAYRLRLRAVPNSGCERRALTRYDAIVLAPGERAEISVCTGARPVELLELRTLEVSEIGALWLRKLPPQALGSDEETARAHASTSDVEICAGIPAVSYAQQLADGGVQWEDIADFYSRHDCEHYRWSAGYVRATQAVEQLPVADVADQD